MTYYPAQRMRCSENLVGQKVEMGLEQSGEDLFVVFNGIRVAIRGKPNTPQAKTWVSIEPGYTVLEGRYQGRDYTKVVFASNEGRPQ